MKLLILPAAQEDIEDARVVCKHGPPACEGAV